MDKLAGLTRRMQECRRRWNRRSLDYVLESAGILHEARVAAKDRRDWNRWVREEVHMSTATAWRHLAVREFLDRNVTYLKRFARLSLAKVYGLVRLSPKVVRKLLKDPRVGKLSEVALARLIDRHLPARRQRLSPSNACRSIMAALDRAGNGIDRWRRSGQGMPRRDYARITARIQELAHSVRRVRGSAKAAG